MGIAKNLDCVVPFRFARRYGDIWTCSDCGQRWKIASNQYDSLLPFGDYTWWTDESNGSWIDRILGAPTGRRARIFTAEPNEEDRRRLSRLIHIFNRFGIGHTTVLAIYDRNPAAHLQYHGAAHNISVALRAYDLGVAEGFRDEGLQPLLIAGLFHDADYVPGDPEDDNIARAVSFARREVPGPLGEAAAALISETWFPHREPRTALGAVLQDADLLQGHERDGKRWLAGLEAESGRPADEGFPTPDMLNTEAGRRFRARSARV